MDEVFKVVIIKFNWATRTSRKEEQKELLCNLCKILQQIQISYLSELTCHKDERKRLHKESEENRGFLYWQKIKEVKV